jgi:hypothetical protein
MNMARSGELKCCIGCGRDTTAKTGYCWRCSGRKSAPFKPTEPNWREEDNSADLLPSDDPDDMPLADQQYHGFEQSPDIDDEDE